MYTQIESVLNSCPLCPLSSDSNDLDVPTPGHFLTLEPLSVISDPNLQHMNRVGSCYHAFIQMFALGGIVLTTLNQRSKVSKSNYLHP